MSILGLILGVGELFLYWEYLYRVTLSGGVTYRMRCSLSTGITPVQGVCLSMRVPHTELLSLPRGTTCTGLCLSMRAPYTQVLSLPQGTRSLSLCEGTKHRSVVSALGNQLFRGRTLPPYWGTYTTQQVYELGDCYTG